MDRTNKWNAGNIPEQQGKVVIVTGSSSGIGFQDAKVLAEKNAEVIIAVRNEGKADKAAEKIRAAYKNARISVMMLDLAGLNSIRKFTEEFKQKYSRLDILINNAGVMVPPYSKTKDGFELQFGTNHLGPFALTGLLFDLLKNTGNSRIISVSSNAHKFGNINFEDLSWEKRKYSPWRAYGDSKLANLYFIYELKRKIEEAKLNIKTASAHPGWTSTELQRHSGFIVNILDKVYAQSIEMGSLPTLYAATAGDVENGDYYGPCGWGEWRGYPKKVESNKLSHNIDIAKKLWEVSEKLTGISY
jgi:NAD(P)-dependent dehydrogenase (short-subunit alcohol dehydrogenase family)